jgi:antirestriction protein
MADLDGIDDFFDSREVIARIEELEAMRHCDRTENEDIELAELREFAEEAEREFSDWVYGVTFISEGHFEDYAKEYAEDMGDMHEARWPYTHIDWEAAADSLKQDFTEIEFRGSPYWGRA